MRTINGLTLAGAGLGLAVAWRQIGGGEPYRFTGKVAIVTGGSRGLGLELARQLLRQGARVGILARSGPELERAAAELRRLGPVLPLQADVRSQASVEQSVARVLEQYGDVDILINNAGVIQVGPLETMTLDDFEAALQVHFWGPLYATRAVLPSMRRRGGGRIVNISSIGGKVAVPHLAPYSASKFALTGLSDALRAELDAMGIRVTTVCPGLIRSGSHLNAQFKGRREAEFSWFATASALPLATIDVRRAARQILGACRRGRAELVITPQARLLVLLQAVAPEPLARAMRMAARVLPAPAPGEASTVAAPGARSRPRGLPAWLTALADRAALRNNEAGLKPF